MRVRRNLSRWNFQSTAFVVSFTVRSACFLKAKVRADSSHNNFYHQKASTLAEGRWAANSPLRFGRKHFNSARG